MTESGRSDQTVNTYVTVCGDYIRSRFPAASPGREIRIITKKTGLVLDLTTGEA
jgi:hypothetical protein